MHRLIKGGVYSRLEFNQRNTIFFCALLGQHKLIYIADNFLPLTEQGASQALQSAGQHIPALQNRMELSQKGLADFGHPLAIVLA